MPKSNRRKPICYPSVSLEQRAGWRIGEWCASRRCSRSHCYELIAAGKIKSVERDGIRLILTDPIAYARGEI
jgi:hypothetical protein